MTALVRRMFFRTRGGSGKDYNRSRIEELRPMMFANVEDVQANLIGEHNLFE